MKFTFTTPIKMGDISNQVTIDHVELCSLSFNFEPVYFDQGKAILSIVLIHKPSGVRHNIVYTDATALAAWNQVNNGNNSVTSVEQRMWNKLVADGKIPVGAIGP